VKTHLTKSPGNGEAMAPKWSEAPFNNNNNNKKKKKKKKKLKS
jgi:hypothetical protein